ncbi:MAG: phage minor capsid protein [Ruminococcus sp.]
MLTGIISGTVTGLMGANCNHSYSPFVIGVDERTYTDEELDRMNAEDNTPKEYNGKQYTKYEALQRQRRLETTMRAERQKINRLIQGGADEDDILAAKVRYNGTSDEYVKFSRAMGLPQQRQRVTVDGLGNIGDIKKRKFVDTSGAKTVAKSTESGIINKQNSNFAKATEIFNFSENIGEVSPQAIADALKNSYIGQETLKMLSEKGVKPILDYSAKSFSYRGEQQGKKIIIYMNNISNVNVAAQTVIHETTHLYYDIGQCQWAEAVCFAREKMFLTGRPLTIQEKRYIVKLAKQAYPEFCWKKGGYGYGKRKKLN